MASMNCWAALGDDLKAFEEVVMDRAATPSF